MEGGDAAALTPAQTKPAAPASRVSKAEPTQDMLVVRSSGEVLTVMEVLQRGLVMADCCSIHEGADTARQQFSAVHASAKIKSDWLGRGLENLDKVISDLGNSFVETRQRLEIETKQEEETILERSAAAFAGRRAELERMISELATQERIVAERTNAILTCRCTLLLVGSTCCHVGVSHGADRTIGLLLHWGSRPSFSQPGIISQLTTE